MTYVRSGSLNLWTERSGDPDDPAVLLIMGAMAQGIGWPDPLVERLVAGGRQVIRYDHRDTGQSDGVDFDGAPGRDLPPPAPAFLASVRAAAGLPRATHDERVAADVVVYEAQSGGVLPYDREAARDLADRYFTRARDWTRAANHQRVGGGGGEPPSPSAITAPTLVLAATADPIFPPGHAEALAAAIPGARLAEVPGMGHTFLSPGLPEHVADLILAHTGG